MTWFSGAYDTGTASVANGSTAVTGIGTAWNSGVVSAGDIFTGADGRSVAIAAVTDDTHLVLAWNWPGATQTAGNYRVNYVAMPARVLEKTREVIEGLKTVDANGRGLFFNYLGATGATDPGTGNLALDNIPASATTLYISETDANSLSVAGLLGLIGGGSTLIIRSISTAAYVAYTVASPPTDSGAYRTAALTYVGSGGVLATGEAVGFSWGKDGSDGIDGVSAVRFGTTVPSSGLGANGDLYLRTTTGDLYAKASGAWTLQGNLTGPAGATGAVGSQILTGSGVPSSGLGANGDFYLNTATGDYYKKASGAWGSILGNLKGPTGSTGATGSAGANGSVWYEGTGDPASGTGANGDLYLQTGTGSTGVLGDVWSKAAGAWTKGINIRGASGAGTGDVIGPSGAVDSNFASFNTSTGKLLKDSGISLDTDATLSANSSSRVPAQSAVKNYIDNAVTGLTWKPAVIVATTANITLSGEQTIDGVLTSASRVLVKNQTTASANGIYLSGSGAWTRVADADTGAELVGATVMVQQGTVGADTQWTCTNNAITLGTTAVVFAQISGAGTYSAAGGLGVSGNQFTITDAILNAFRGLTGAANKIAYFTGASAMAVTDFTAAGINMVGAASAAAQTALLSAFTGDSGSGGVKGLVPAPAAGDAAAGKVLGAGGGWVAQAGGGGGMTLLGTLTTTSGTTQSLTGIAAGYNQIYFEAEGLSNTTTNNYNFNVALSSTNGAAYGSAVPFATITAAGDTVNAYGLIFNVSSALAASKFLQYAGSTNGGAAAGATILIATNTAAIVNAIRFSLSGGAFDGGTIRIYGVK